MTVSYERTRAVKLTRVFLQQLSDDDLVDVNLRQAALKLLRHYPLDSEMDMACRNESLLDTSFAVFEDWPVQQQS